MLSKNVKNRLKILRKKILKMSQRQFANYIGAHLHSVKNWEQGVSVPELTMLIHISEKCNVSLDWLFNRDEYITKDVYDMLAKIHDVLAFYGSLSEDQKKILEAHLKVTK